MAEKSKIILSRTDSIGDMMLTLPLAGMIKRFIPDSEVWLIGRSYTRPVVEACTHVDHFLDREEIVAETDTMRRINPHAILFVFPDRAVAWAAKKARIKLRVGTSHRLFHWFTCNKLLHFSRKNSPEHEAVLNQKLLSPLGIAAIPKEAVESFYGFNRISPLPAHLASVVDGKKFNLVIHPKSKGSAREWPVERYHSLAKRLSPEKFNVLMTGTLAEGKAIRREFPEGVNVANDLTGKLNLTEMISLLARCDGMVAGSTGPLHIAAALKKNTCGIYPATKPMHPARWGPLGERAGFLVSSEDCSHCDGPQRCRCIREITVDQVEKVVNSWVK
jgi:heptosyltransferase III